MWDSIATWWHANATQGWVFVAFIYLWATCMLQKMEIKELEEQVSELRFRDFARKTTGDRA